MKLNMHGMENDNIPSKETNMFIYNVNRYLYYNYRGQVSNFVRKMIHLDISEVSFMPGTLSDISFHIGHL